MEICKSAYPATQSAKQAYTHNVHRDGKCDKKNFFNVSIDKCSSIIMQKMHTHTHTVQTDGSKGQCGSTEIFWEEKCLELTFEGRESSRVPDVLVGDCSRYGGQSVRKCESHGFCGWNIRFWACVCLTKSGESGKDCKGVAAQKDKRERNLWYRAKQTRLLRRGIGQNKHAFYKEVLGKTNTRFTKRYWAKQTRLLRSGIGQNKHAFYEEVLGKTNTPFTKRYWAKQTRLLVLQRGIGQNKRFFHKQVQRKAGTPFTNRYRANQLSFLHTGRCQGYKQMFYSNTEVFQKTVSPGLLHTQAVSRVISIQATNQSINTQHYFRKSTKSMWNFTKLTAPTKNIFVKLQSNIIS